MYRIKQICIIVFIVCDFSLPKVVKRRIKAMKKLQFDIVNVEADFYKEVHTLECKYASKYASMFAKVCISLVNVT